MSELKNFAIVNLRTEQDWNPKEGEYELYLVSMLTPLILGGIGADDVPLIEECIANAVSEGRHLLPADGLIEIRLRETGEREDVHWLKYYEIEDWTVIQVNKREPTDD